MKKLFILLVVSFITAGCSTSVIRISGKIDRSDTYPMYGKDGERDFYTPIELSDSLKLIWEAETNGSFPQSSVTYFGNYIFINDLSGRIFCFDIRTGKITGQLKHKGTIFTTPLIYKYNVIYVESTNDEDKSIVRVYNFLEGKQLNEKKIDGIVKTELLMEGKEFYFVTEKGLLYKYSHIGDQYWVKDLESWVHASPVSDGKNIYIIDDSGDLITIDRDSGVVTSRKKTGIKLPGNLTLRSNSIYFGDKSGTVYCIDKNDGSVKWKYQSGFTVTANPVTSGDRLFAVNLRGDIAALDFNTGKELWKQRTSGVFNSAPALTKNCIVVPDLANRILFLDKTSGIIKKTIELPNRAKLSPVFNNNIMLIGFDRGVIRAYEFI